jgi:hypothetical protein
VKRRGTPFRAAVALLSVIVGAIGGVMMAAAPAWACPACLGKNEALPPALKPVGLFLLVPFALFGLTVLVVRRLNKDAGPR